MKSLDQHRSKHAADQVDGWRTLSADKRRELGPQCKELPSLLRINGLPAVLLAKRQDNIDHALTDWLLEGEASLGFDPKKELARQLAEDRTLYRRAFAEAIAYAAWLKRWAQACPELGAQK